MSPVHNKEEIQRMLKGFSPEQQGALRNMATMRVENRIMKDQLGSLQKDYDDIYMLFISILAALPEKELRIHKTQLLRFKAEYRIDRRLDEVSGEIIYKLLTITDNFGDANAH